VVGLFQPPLSTLIKDFKFNEKLHMGPLLASLLLERYQLAMENDVVTLPDAIISVPLHKKRLSFRGYNQAQQIATHLSKLLAVPLLENVVIRTKETHDQATINLKQRKSNIKGAFKVIAPVPNHIVIVDDVITSGSTCNELSKTLKKAGVEKVDVVAIAKTPLQHK